MIEETPQKLVKVRLNFLFDQPYLGTYMAQRPDVFSDKVPTAGTDSNRTHWNEPWFDSLTSAERDGVKEHEGWHDVLEHPIRIAEKPDFYKNKKQANVACDVIVNAKCLANKKVLPKDGILPETWPYGVDNFYMISEMTLPQAYLYIGKNFHCDQDQPNPQGLPPLPDHDMDSDVLPWEPEGDGQGDDSDSSDNKCGDAKSGQQSNQPTPEQIEEKLAENRKLLSQALQAGKLAGNLPAELEKQITEMLNPKLKWTKMLTNLIARSSKTNYSFFPSNRRFIHKRMHLPSLVGQSLGRGIWITDTSGSVDEHTTNEIDAELKGMYSTHEGECTIISADTCVQNVEHMDHNNARRFKPTWKGGGGTNYRGAFRWIKENIKGKVDFCIYATDGHCESFPKEKPNFPVYWVLWDQVSFNPPFGKVIYVN